MSFVITFSSNKKKLILYVGIKFYYLLITYFNIVAACKDKDFPSQLEFAWHDSATFVLSGALFQISISKNEYIWFNDAHTQGFE